MDFHILIVVLLLAHLVQSCRSVTLDATLMNVCLRALELSAALLEDVEDIPSVSGANIYIDEPDAALFVREGNYCFAVFRGTTANFLDWMENLDLFTGTICSPAEECCQARHGFVLAYTSPNYKDELEEDVRSCVDECPDCEVVFTGKSQGGAIAAVAAVAMEDVDPTIITFGQPGSINGLCSPINVDKYYRFVNTIVDGGEELDYDPVPYLNFDSDQMGHLFIMGNDDQNVVYYGNGYGPTISNFRWLEGAHMTQGYVNRLFSYQTKVPLGTNGWDVGFLCSADEECIGHCVDKHCYQGLDGDPCNYDSDCDSGRCEGFGSRLWSGECTPQLERRQWCNENSDCKSEECRWTFRCA